MQQVQYKSKQGETFRRVLRFSKNGSAIDITGWALKMDVRQNAQSDVLCSATITLRDQTTDKGVADLVIAKNLTAALQPITHKFDMCADASGERKFYVEGTFEIEETITRG